MEDFESSVWPFPGSGRQIACFVLNRMFVKLSSMFYTVPCNADLLVCKHIMTHGFLHQHHLFVYDFMEPDAFAF
jgi:hypothetical protein